MLTENDFKVYECKVKVSQKKEKFGSNSSSK